MAWHNGCDIEIQRGGKNGLHPRSRVHPVFHISKVKIFKGEPRRTRADELRDGKLDKFEGEGGGYKYWPLDPDEWEVSEIIDHRGEKASGKGRNKKRSTLEYFVHWAGFNVEDYTWEKESDVVAEGDGAGANELVEEYWERREFLDSRAQASQRTGAELSEDDLDAARISYLEEQWHIKRNQFRCQDANKWDERVGDCHVKSAGYEKGER